jgi:hypothetical protein
MIGVGQKFIHMIVLLQQFSKIYMCASKWWEMSTTHKLLKTKLFWQRSRKLISFEKKSATLAGFSQKSVKLMGFRKEEAKQKCFRQEPAELIGFNKKAGQLIDFE